MERLGRIVPVLLLLSLVAGCWDRREINDIAFVLGSAIDKEGDKYRATIQIVLPSQLGGAGSSGGGGGTSGKKSFMILSQTDESVRMANFEEQLSVSRQLYFAHRRVIMVGEEAARDGLEPFVDLLGRIPQNRLTAFMIATEGQAYPYLKQEVEIEKFPSEVVRELAINYMNQPTSVKDVIHRMLSDGIDVVMPAVRFIEAESGIKGSKRVMKMDGLALFHQNRLVRTVYGEDAAFLMLAMAALKLPEVTVEPPKGEGKIIFHLTNVGARTRSFVEGRGKIRFNVTITGKAVVAENASNYLISDVDTAQAAQRELLEKLRKGIARALQDAQKAKADPLGFGKLLAREHPAVWEAVRTRWEDLYPQCEIDVNVRVRLGSTGTFVGPLGRPEGELTR